MVTSSKNPITQNVLILLFLRVTEDGGVAERAVGPTFDLIKVCPVFASSAHPRLII